MNTVYIHKDERKNLQPPGEGRSLFNSVTNHIHF